MREITFEMIAKAVESLFLNACHAYPPEVVPAFENALAHEESPYGKASLQVAIDNARIAREQGLPLCQDTGMAVVFAEVGQEVHIAGGLLEDAVNEGVRRAYISMRKSVLSPLERVNTGTNTPAVLHVSLVKGDRLTLHAAPKGFGSENMSALKMLKPSDGLTGVTDFIVQTVSSAGANPCPPVVVGVGIGGTMEKAALMAKHSLLRKLGAPSEDPKLAQLEEELLARINRLGIGPQGLGGRITALAVHLEQYPTHIAGLPVAVNMQCHCARHASAVL